MLLLRELSPSASTTTPVVVVVVIVIAAAIDIVIAIAIMIVACLAASPALSIPSVPNGVLGVRPLLAADRLGGRCRWYRDPRDTRSWMCCCCINTATTTSISVAFGVSVGFETDINIVIVIVVVVIILLVQGGTLEQLRLIPAVVNRRGPSS